MLDKHINIKRIVYIYVLSILFTAIIISPNLILSASVNDNDSFFRLEANKKEEQYLNLSQTTSHHWKVWLREGREYSVTLSPAQNSSDANMWFHVEFPSVLNGINHFEDNGSGGSDETYEFSCEESGEYNITVFSDKSAYYSLTIRDKTDDEICLIILCILLVLIFIDFRFNRQLKKRKKRRLFEIPPISPEDDNWNRFRSWLRRNADILTLIGLIVGIATLIIGVYLQWGKIISLFS